MTRRPSHLAFALLLLLVSLPAHSAIDVSSWTYVINALGPETRAAIDETKYPLVVIDYSSDGTEGGELTRDEISALQNGPCGRRVVLSYLSIGEAEDYRFYWDPRWTDQGANDPDRPAWLGPANPDWPGNFKVRYWMPEWQAILLPSGAPSGATYLERLVARGFDGVYLDIIDAYEFFGPDGNGENPSSADDMITLVSRIAAFGRSARPGFLVVPQNALNLGSHSNAYVALVDAIGVEDLYYIDDTPRTPIEIDEMKRDISRFQAAGKSVLSIDYPTTRAAIDDYWSKASTAGYVPYVANRELDRVFVHPGHEPACAPAGRTDGAIPILTLAGSESAQNPAYSPVDGVSILYTRFRNGYNIGPAGLFTIAPSQGEPRALLDEADVDSVNLPGTSWNATTHRIVFSSDREERHEIWTMAESGGDLRRVTKRSSGGTFQEPTYSPDGEWIVFEGDEVGLNDEPMGSIWKVRADGSGLVRLTPGVSAGEDDRQPNWSPVGDRIVFQRRRAGSDDWDLVTMSDSGGEVRSLTAGASEDTDVSFSPDGRWVVYSSNFGGLDAPGLFVIPAAGGDPIRATFDGGWSDSAPSWSPDGEWIAFETRRGTSEGTPASLFRIAAPPETRSPLFGSWRQASVEIGRSLDWTLSLASPAASDTAISLAVSDQDAITVPSSVTIRSGNRSASVSLQTKATTELVRVTASLSPEVRAFADVTITPSTASFAPDWVVPGVAHSEGAGGSYFRSAFWCVNPSTSDLLLRLAFVPATASGSGGAGPSRDHWLPAGASIEASDILAEEFGVTESAFGSVIVSAPSSAPSLLVAARTYNDPGGNGTFGQWIEGMRVGAPPLSEIRLDGLAGDARSRTNVGIVNLGGESLGGSLRLVDAEGAPLGKEIAFSVAPWALTQLNQVNVAASAPEASPFSAIVLASGKASAYASRLDNITSDPIFLAADAGRSDRSWIDGIATAPGANGTYFRTELSMTNRGIGGGALSVRFTPRGASTPAAEVLVSLDGGKSKLWRDVLPELFGIAEGAGTIEIAALAATPLPVTIAAWARGWSDRGSQGSYGQLIPAFGRSDLLPESGAQLIGLREDATFRTNVGLVNIGAEAIDAKLVFVHRSGAKLGERVVSIGGGTSLFLHRALVEIAPNAPSRAGRLVVVPSRPGELYAWASVIDNISSDPTFIRPMTSP